MTKSERKNEKHEQTNEGILCPDCAEEVSYCDNCDKRFKVGDPIFCIGDDNECGKDHYCSAKCAGEHSTTADVSCSECECTLGNCDFCGEPVTRSGTVRCVIGEGHFCNDKCFEQYLEANITPAVIEEYAADRDDDDSDDSEEDEDEDEDEPEENTSREKVFSTQIVHVRGNVTVNVNGMMLYESKNGKVVEIDASGKTPVINVVNDEGYNLTIAGNPAVLNGDYTLKSGIDMAIGKTFAHKISGRKLKLNVTLTLKGLVFSFKK